MVTMSPFNRLLLLTAAVILPLSGSAETPEPSPPATPPHVHGVNVPLLATEGGKDLSVELPRLRNRERTPVVLFFDNQGRVDSTILIPDPDTAWQQSVTASVEGLRFLLSEQDESRPPSLTIATRHLPRTRSAELVFPLDETGRVADPNLLIWTLEFNEHYLPDIRYFPSYACDLGPDNPDKGMKYVLFRVSLDSTGAVIDRQLVSTNYSAFVDQINSLLLYAQFSPAMIDLEYQDCEFFLMVSFFHHTLYPTLPFGPVADSLSEIDDREQPRATLKTRLRRQRIASSGPEPYYTPLQVRVLPAAEGIVSLPLPHPELTDSVATGILFRYLGGNQTALISIDTLGKTRLLSTSAGNRETKKAVTAFVNALRFYPAISSDGAKKRYRGLVELGMNGTTTAAVRYLWLE